MEETNNQVNLKNEKIENNKNKSRMRIIIVLVFILLFAIFSYISLRGNYLEYLELGEKYIEIFYF